MPSKELLLVRLHMSGLGLEPRWLLKRLKTILIDTTLSVHAPQIIPCQVLRKVEVATEAERTAAVETGKPKEAVARAWCWKGSLLKGLQRTGEP